MLALMGAHTSLWWARLILFCMGFSMAQVFVSAQAASFATISGPDTGRASTLYNASRQLGGAIGVALLTTTIVIVGPVHLVDGHAVANLTAYRICFLVAAGAALLGVMGSLMISDKDAAQTMVNPHERKRAAAGALAPSGAAQAAGPVLER
jgi:MFS family permease